VVALVSDDRGLSAAVNARLGGAWSTQHHGASRRFLTTFTHPRGWKRRHAEPEVQPAPPAAPVPSGNVLRIDTAEACAWASQQRTQREASLVETARAIDQHPAILTQLSTTRASFRGLARILDSRNALLGVCSPDDGVELAAPLAIDTCTGGTRARSSSIGPGAVQIEGLGATVHTALPTAWLTHRSMDDAVQLGPTTNRLADADLLAREALAQPRGWTLHVALTSRVASPGRPAALVAEVLADAAAEVQGWWTTDGSRRPKSQRDVVGERAAVMVVDAVRTIAQQAVLANGERRELIVMAPTVDRVIVERAAAMGVVTQAHAQRLGFALLSLDADLVAGQEVQVVPIQHLRARDLSDRCPGAGLSEDQWNALRRLPIVVSAANDLGVRLSPSASSSE
jgi:hypothetical protein